MRILYAINARVPTPRAHGIQIMKTCEALARAGAEVELVVPRRYNPITEDPFSYYAVKPLFKITYLPTIDFAWRGVSYAFTLQTLAFALSLAWHLRRVRGDGTLLYVRGELGWLLPLVSRVPFIWENHIPARKKSAEARAVHHAKGIVVVTERYREDLLEEFDVSPEFVVVAPDGVDLSEFRDIGKGAAREKLSLPPDRKLVVYVGSDLPWKGLKVLRAAGTLLPDGYEIIYVGQISSDGAKANERFAGVRPHGEIPLWLSAADILVLTGDPASRTARHYTSPIKLFEYMAAGRPIVATDLPAYRDVLSDESAVLVAPNAVALAEGIIQAAQADQARVDAAREKVQEYSWQKRGERLLAFIRARSVMMGI